MSVYNSVSNSTTATDWTISGINTSGASQQLTVLLPAGLTAGTYYVQVINTGVVPILSSALVPVTFTVSSSGVVSAQASDVALADLGGGGGGGGGASWAGGGGGGQVAGAQTFQGLRMPAGYPASGAGLRMPAGYPATDQTGQQSATTYTVKKGDTLFAIAQKVYGKGNGKQWRKILSANPGCLSRPGNTKTLKVGFILGNSANLVYNNRAYANT